MCNYKKYPKLIEGGGGEIAHPFPEIDSTLLKKE